MRLLFLFFSIVLVNAQSDVNKDYKIIFELGVVSDHSAKISKRNPVFAFGFWYRYPMETDVRLELGGNLKAGAAIYNFDYGKRGEYYQVDSKGYIMNLGARLVKELAIKNQKIEWVSELTLNTMFFDGTGIPDDPIRKPENPNTTQIVIDAESISSLQFGQGLRIWIGNIGIGAKTSFTPYRLWYKTKVPNSFNVISAEATISIKL